MKAYHQTELEHFIQFANDELRGAQLQEVLTFESFLVLQFYLKGQGDKWLVVDLNNNAPMMLIFDENPLALPKQKKPLGLFLNSHARNLYVQKIEHRTEWGRVAEVFLASSEKECVIELQLIPKAANILVRTFDKKSEKKIAWHKPKELVAVQTPEIEEVRSIAAIHKEWLSQIKKPKSGSPLLQMKKKLEKDLEKKRKALAEINKGLSANEAQDWQELGELLKVKNLEEIDRKWDPYLDRQRSRTWNMETAFQKAKSLEKKRLGTHERKRILEEEVARLENNLEVEAELRIKTPPVGLRRKTPQEVKTRKKELASGLVAYLGKSAQDNMKILRQSQAWDIWLHLRDYPSAHAIIHRNKNQEVKPEDLRQIALWLTEESLQKKIRLPGLRLEIIYTECRFVRPIKGDKLGRVHYQNENHFVLTL